MKATTISSFIIFIFIITSCNGQVSKEQKEDLVSKGNITVKTAVGNISLPPPYATKSNAKSNTLIKWPDGKTPVAPEGFTVTKFAENLKNPRWIYIGPNNEVFVSESKSDQISIFQDKDNDGKFETREVFLKGLNKPFGMLILNNFFYVANTDGIYRYPYQKNVSKLESNGEKILEFNSGGYNNHWTRNIIANQDGSKIFVSVGSASNVGEHGMDAEKRRANILEINPDGSGERIFASGLRNPVGMDLNPVNNELWTAVNERDELGDDLVPDYITSIKQGGFYGWPYSYFGNNLDPRLKGKGKELAAKAIIPDVSVGAHAAALGFTFYDKDVFPSKYKNGAFVGLHGSWNRSVISGYKVIFVPFNNGKPSGKPQDFLTGFVANESTAEVYGRPVAVVVMNDGSLLVTDDGANIIWKVTLNK